MVKKVAALVVAVLALVLFVGTGAASAHVTVSAPGATRGGADQTISFRVPNESDKATTTEVQISFPTATPIASVLPQSHPGWTITTKTVKLSQPIHTDDGDITDAVSTVTWKAAAGGGIAVGQFDEFTVIAGLLPDTATLTFGAIQTYSDGTVVKWIESPAPGSTAAPDHPAPTITLAAATTSGSSAKSSSAKSSDTGPVVLSVIALVVAAGALGLAFVSRAKATRT